MCPLCSCHVSHLDIQSNWWWKRVHRTHCLITWIDQEHHLIDSETTFWNNWNKSKYKTSLFCVALIWKAIIWKWHNKLPFYIIFLPLISAQFTSKVVFYYFFLTSYQHTWDWGPSFSPWTVNSAKRSSRRIMCSVPSHLHVYNRSELVSSSVDSRMKSSSVCCLC